MHPRHVAQRRAAAQEKIAALSDSIAETSGLDASAIHTARGRDTAHTAMLKDEATADFLEELDAYLKGVTGPNTGEGVAVTDIEALDAVGPQLAATLRQHGYATLEDLALASPEDLDRIPGLGQKKIDAIRAQLVDMGYATPEGEEKPPEDGG